MKKIFLAGSAIFGAIPGISIIVNGLGTPPQYETLFGGIIESIGVLTLLVLWINRDKIKEAPINKVNLWIFILLLLFVGSMLGYLILFNLCVVSHPLHGTVYYPIWLNGRILELVNRKGSRWAALDEYGYYNIYKHINEMGSLYISLTTAILVLIYQSIFTSLTIASGMAALRTDQTIKPFE